jgi:DNA-binding protein HU-beta
MQKTELIRAVAERSGLTQLQVRQAIESLTAIVGETLAAGEKVSIPGFGTFDVRVRNERQGINPQTRERITIPSGRAPGFVPGVGLREKVRVPQAE